MQPGHSGVPRPRPLPAYAAWGPTRGSALVGVVVGAVLAGGLPVFVLDRVADAGRSDGWVASLVIMAWAGVRLAVLIGRGRARLFDFFFWLFTYIFLGLAPTAQIRTGTVGGPEYGIDPTMDLPTALVVGLGLLTYEVASATSRRRSAARHAPRRRRTGVSPSRTVGVFAVGAVAAAFYVALLGAAVFLGSREAATAARVAAFPDPAVRSVVGAAALVPLLIALAAFRHLRTTEPTAARRRLLTLLAVVCVVAIFLVVSPVSSARYTVGTVLFALAVSFGAVRTAVRVRTTMVVTLLAFLFVFPVADAFRRASGADLERQGFFSEYVASGDYDAFAQVANALSYWRDGLVEPLRQATGSLLFWVPRSVWPGKPVDTGIVLAEYRGYPETNLSAPLWAEALVNGGPLLVVLVFAILGYAVRRLDDLVAVSTGAAGGGLWFVVGAVFPVYTTILLRGSLLQATGTFAVALVCVLVVRAGRDGPPPSRAAAPRPDDEAPARSATEPTQPTQPTQPV